MNWLWRLDNLAIKVYCQFLKLSRSLILLLYDPDQCSVITQGLIGDAHVLTGFTVLSLAYFLEGSVFEQTGSLFPADLREVLSLELQVYGLLRQRVQRALETEPHSFKRSFAHDVSLKY